MTSRILQLLAFLLALSNGAAVLACDCVPQAGTLEAQVSSAAWRATAVFSAEVVDTEDFMSGFEHIQATKLRVLENWKGQHAPGSIVKTATITDCCMCGLTLGKGDRLLVYVGGQEPYRLSDCSRTAKLDKADAELAVLRKLHNGK